MFPMQENGSGGEAMVWVEEHGQLLGAPLILAVCFVWVLGWAIAHCLVPIQEVRLQQHRKIGDEPEEEERRRSSMAFARASRISHVDFADQGVGGELPQRSSWTSEAGSPNTPSSSGRRSADRRLFSPAGGGRRTMTPGSLLSNPGSMDSWTASGFSAKADSESTAVQSSLREASRRFTLVSGDVLETYRRLLNREAVYAALATSAGLALWIQDLSHRRAEEQLLTSFSLAHQVLFSMAIGHSLVKLLEDAYAASLLHWGVRHTHGSHARLHRSVRHSSATFAVFAGTILHHLAVVGTYCFILWTWKLGGLGVQLLLFEAPELLFALRQSGYARYAEWPLPWMRKLWLLRCFWFSQYAVLVAFRVPGLLAWPCAVYGLWPYEGRLASTELESTELLVGWLWCGFFAMASLCTVFLLRQWRQEDEGQRLRWILRMHRKQSRLSKRTGL